MSYTGGKMDTKHYHKDKLSLNFTWANLSEQGSSFMAPLSSYEHVLVVLLSSQINILGAVGQRNMKNYQPG